MLQHISVCRGGAETVDIVAAMLAPYMHIKDMRQQLQVKQTCLIDCLPAKVRLQHTNAGNAAVLPTCTGLPAMHWFPRCLAAENRC